MRQILPDSGRMCCSSSSNNVTYLGSGACWRVRGRVKIRQKERKAMRPPHRIKCINKILLGLSLPCSSMPEVIYLRMVCQSISVSPVRRPPLKRNRILQLLLLLAEDRRRADSGGPEQSYPGEYLWLVSIDLSARNRY